MQIFIFLNHDTAIFLYRPTALHQHIAYKEKEKHDKNRSGNHQALTSAFADRCSIHIPHGIEQAERDSQHHHTKAQAYVPRIGYSLQSVPRGSPLGDGVAHQHRVFRNLEISTRKERTHSGTGKERTENTIDNQEPTVGVSAKQIAGFILKLISYRLQNEREKQEHPNPIGATERGGIKKRETGEKCAAKGYKSSKREFPFASGTIYKQQSFVFRFAQAKHQHICPLYKHQHNKEGSE